MNYTFEFSSWIKQTAGKMSKRVKHNDWNYSVNNLKEKWRLSLSQKKINFYLDHAPKENLKLNHIKIIFKDV